MIRAEWADQVGHAAFAVMPSVLVGAGDIADCDSDAHKATAALVEGIPGFVFVAGDNAYHQGSHDQFGHCYHVSWGQFRTRTRPAPGNHEYLTPSAAGYFDYFRESAGPRGHGYYSYDIGSWHVAVLNSGNAVHASSPQLQWLRADLAQHPTLCSVAYWHHPRFSSGREGSSVALKPVWEVLYDAGVDVVVSGHDHHYERFAPQTPDGVSDPTRGIRQFIVGTGGGELFSAGPPLQNTEARQTGIHGVLKLTLHPTGYDWQFISVQGSQFSDSGSDRCH
jgi:hypothetical protein